MIKIPDGLKVAVLMLGGIAASFFFNPIMVFGAVIAASIAFTLLGKPFWLLIFLIFWSMTVFIWDSLFQSGLLKRFDDVMILLMAGVYAGNFALRRIRPVPYLNIYLTTVGLVFFSMVVNRSSPANMGLFLLAYCAPYLIFCLVHAVRTPNLSRKMIKLIIGVYIFGVIMNIGWYLGINPVFNIHLGTIDFAKGTLGGCDVFAYFTIFILFLSLSQYKHANLRKKKVGFGILIGICLMQLYFAYTNHAFIYLAILFPLYLFISRQRIIGYFALGGLAAIVIIMLSTVGQSRMAAEMGGYQGFQLTDPKVLGIRWRSFMDSHKIDLYEKIVWKGYEQGFYPWLIGHGPGAGVGTVARTRPSDYTYKMLGDYYLTYSGRMEMEGHSITQSPWSGMTSLWSEIGLFGTLLFYMLPLIPAGKVFKRLRQNRYVANPEQEVVGEAFIMYVALYILINLMNDVWSTDYFTFLLWMLAALALQQVETREGQEEISEEMQRSLTLAPEDGEQNGGMTAVPPLSITP